MASKKELIQEIERLRAQLGAAKESMNKWFARYEDERIKHVETVEQKNRAITHYKDRLRAELSRANGLANLLHDIKGTINANKWGGAQLVSSEDFWNSETYKAGHIRYHFSGGFAEQDPETGDMVVTRDENE